MAELLDVLGVAQAVVFATLALATTRRWRHHRAAPSAWAAASFAVLGFVAVAGVFLPDDPDDVGLWEIKALLAALFLFPYLLYRFTTSFRPAPRSVDAFAAVITAFVVGGIFVFQDLPAAGEPRTDALLAFTAVVLVQWAALSVLVARWLWQAGAGRPTVVRRRMRTLSLGALGLVVAALINTLFPADDDPGLVQVLTAVVVLATGPLFLIGLAPPRLVLAAWRRPEEAALYDAEAALMAASGTQEVADGLLPHLVRTMGARSAQLTAADGTVVASHGGPARRHDLTVAVRGGNLAITADAYTPFFGHDEVELLHRLGRLTDLALQRAEIADRERVASADLEAANAAMREFVAIASHDLRTPIAVIKGYAELIIRADGSAPADLRQHATTIGRHADHLSAIVDDLLTISRLDSGAVEPDAQPLAVEGLIGEVVHDLGCADLVTIDADDDVVATADLDHMTRILRNLIENARHHGRAPIDISAHRVDGHIELRVHDHGAGVPAEFQPRLFQRFARSDRSRGESKHGTGLGLSIVQGLARAGGGDAWYEPQSSGACFAVRLPAARQEST